MIFEDLNNNKDNKPIDKHIKLKTRQLVNLNMIQTAYQSQTNQHLNLNDLISMSIDVFIKEIQRQIVNNNELEAIKFIENLNKEGA